MPPLKNLSNQKFERLTAVKISHQDKTFRAYWLCKCDCGKEKTVAGWHLTRGTVKSCGCLHKEKMSTHGGTYTRLYTIWGKMKSRCTDKNATNYHNYGFRGIKICSEWLHDFKCFETWAIQNGYNSKLTLDRINNSGNYEPVNCKWATHKEQSYNTRRNLLLNFDGELLNTQEIFEKFGVNRNAVYHIRRTRVSMEEVIKEIKNRKIN